MSTKIKIINLKRTLNSVICFFMLAAFMGGLGFELISVPVQKQYTEVSRLTLHSAINLSVISEESDSNYEEFDSNQLATELTLVGFSYTPIYKSQLFITSNSIEKVLFENNLYLQNRCLRV
jgi:hypothetical protein